MGIARTFQNIRLFKEMTLLENVVVGAYRHIRLPQPAAGPAGFREHEKRARERAHELLTWMRLDHKANDLADNLSYGEQRRLELRALATEPKLLLLDEPVAGMNTGERAELMREILAIRERGYTILMIEHDMRFVMGLCEQIAVLNFGKIIAAAGLKRSATTSRSSRPTWAAKTMKTPNTRRPQNERNAGSPRTRGQLRPYRSRPRHRPGPERQEITAWSAPTAPASPHAAGAVRAAAQGERPHQLEGEDITNLPPHQLVARGIVQVPEGRAILTTMTVLENLELGAYRRGLKNVGSDLEYVFNLFPRLKERINGMAGNLSGGEQQMLAIGRALMGRACCCWTSRRWAWLPIVVQEIFRSLRAINADGLTLFLVEQTCARR